MLLAVAVAGRLARAEQKPGRFKPLNNQHCPNLCDYGYSNKF
ncbi:hypothetical protein [Nostoc sp. DedQUE09]|nr:hypothetical protein [Nostoc sp. DedQUE09]MDZ7953082.1 hypothetical protein [Nostoc sp. DedQUE09]